MTDDKHITIIDDIIAPLTDDQHAALLELAKVHPDLGANVTSFPFQPLDLTAFWAAINDVGVKVYEAFQPFIDQIAGVIDRIDAGRISHIHAPALRVRTTHTRTRVGAHRRRSVAAAGDEERSHFRLK